MTDRERLLHELRLVAFAIAYRMLGKQHRSSCYDPSRRTAEFSRRSTQLLEDNLDKVGFQVLGQ
jgi:hypothetical protein